MREDSEKPTLVWDIGRVLVDWDRTLIYRNHMSPEKLAWWTEYGVSMRPFIHLFDEGTPFLEAVAAQKLYLETHHADKLKEFPDYEQLLLDYRPGFLTALWREIPGTRKIRDHLRSQGHRTLALTNFAPELWDDALTKYPWLEEGWDGLVMSGREKMAKPGVEIFNTLVQRYDVSPNNAIFIDDSPANVVTARQVGFDAITFSSAEQLSGELNRRNISTPKP